MALPVRLMRFKATLKASARRFDRWWYRRRHRLGALTAGRPGEPELRCFERLDQYQSYLAQAASRQQARAAIAQDCIVPGKRFYVPGYCEPCEKAVDFLVDYHGTSEVDRASGQPNWRERLVCPCGLNNRMRLALHVFRRHCRPAAADALYLTEQLSPLYRWMSSRYPKLVGSEYLGSQLPFGMTRADGIRNETITALSFEDNRFDHLLSFDVLEHVPEYAQALRELQRVLKPGGYFLFTVPFIATRQETLVRARARTDGSVEHLLPAEYHADVLRAEGCLCFYHFGWDLLDACRDAGFSNARLLALWSREFGYLGPEQLLFLARK